MNLIFDNIIFSLQPFGGISVVWGELLQRAISDPDLSVKMLDYAAANDYRKQITPSLEQCVNKKTRPLERYRTPDYSTLTEGIFHSSYFRIMNEPHIANVTTIHDLTYHYYRKGLAKAVHLWEEEKALRHSAQIICVSENTRQDVLAHYPFLDEQRVHVVYNGMSDAFRSISCANITPFETRGYLLYVGNRSVTYKNFDVAVETARLVQMPLVIVGGALSPMEEEWLGKRLGANNYWVKTLPSQEELVAIYNHAYCLLYPSAYEGFGLPIIEAQRTGCLVIGQDCSSVPEVIGKGGICVAKEANHDKLASSMAQEIRSLLNGTTNANELIEKGKINSQSFSWNRTYEQTKKIYQLIEQNK